MNEEAITMTQMAHVSLTVIFNLIETYENVIAVTALLCLLVKFGKLAVNNICI